MRDKSKVLFDLIGIATRNIFLKLVLQINGRGRLVTRMTSLPGPYDIHVAFTRYSKNQNLSGVKHCINA